MCSLFLFHFQFLLLFGFLCGGKCECVHTMRVGMVLVVRPNIHYNSEKSTSACEEIKILPYNFNEGGSFRSLIKMLPYPDEKEFVCKTHAYFLRWFTYF